ncbi:MAG: DUF6580 family putative transport protein [Candidatus Omnitrophota bacterium]
MLAVALLVLGILSRFFIHAPNYTPVIALALFGGMYLRKEESLWMPLALMAISDLVLGLHQVMVFTWGSVLLISLLGMWQKEKKGVLPLAAKSLAAPVLFFILTNFGCWLVMYPLTFEGFIRCYVAAIPFFRNTLASTIIYSLVLFGAYELIALRVKGTRFAWLTA